jgi:SAM-dependent methyltransferase
MTDHHDWAAMADYLVLNAETYEPYYAQAFQEMPAPRRILDIGSGPGVVACYLAKRFPATEVVAVDGSPELLEIAADRARRLGVRLETRPAEFPDGLAELGTADFVWSAQVMHHVGDQQDALKRLATLVEPGGTLSIVEGGLTPRWLPRDVGFGRPGLQSRLDVLTEVGFAEMRAELPGSVAAVEDWPAMLRTAGLTDARNRTYLVDHPAPLADGPRRHVRRLLERSREMLADSLDADDRTTVDRLLDPDDPAGIDHRPDAFFLAAKTVHSGSRSAH